MATRSNPPNMQNFVDQLSERPPPLERFPQAERKPGTSDEVTIRIKNISGKPQSYAVYMFPPLALTEHGTVLDVEMRLLRMLHIPADKGSEAMVSIKKGWRVWAGGIVDKDTMTISTGVFTLNPIELGTKTRKGTTVKVVPSPPSKLLPHGHIVRNFTLQASPPTLPPSAFPQYLVDSPPQQAPPPPQHEYRHHAHLLDPDPQRLPEDSPPPQHHHQHRHPRGHNHPTHAHPPQEQAIPSTVAASAPKSAVEIRARKGFFTPPFAPPSHSSRSSTPSSTLTGTPAAPSVVTTATTTTSRCATAASLSRNGETTAATIATTTTTNIAAVTPSRLPPPRLPPPASCTSTRPSRAASRAGSAATTATRPAAPTPRPGHNVQATRPLSPRSPDRIGLGLLVKTEADDAWKCVPAATVQPSYRIYTGRSVTRIFMGEAQPVVLARVVGKHRRRKDTGETLEVGVDGEVLGEGALQEELDGLSRGLVVASGGSAGTGKESVEGASARERIGTGGLRAEFDFMHEKVRGWLVVDRGDDWGCWEVV